MDFFPDFGLCISKTLRQTLARRSPILELDIRRSEWSTGLTSGESERRRGRVHLKLSTNRQGVMDWSESYTHSFVVKIWLEDETPARWRGHITHVPGGERQYVDDLEQIPVFIAPYLEAMGVEPGTLTRLKRWLSNWRFGLNRQH